VPGTVEATDLLLVLMRWLHALAAIAWIGAILFELLVVQPAWNGNPPSEVLDSFDAAMREIVQAALIVFLVSGAILTFERLSRGAAGTAYVITLAVKIVLSLAMFQVGFRFRRARGARRLRGLKMLSLLGVVIVLLATILKWLYERALLPG
jgi:putative copper export protein